MIRYGNIGPLEGAGCDLRRFGCVADLIDQPTHPGAVRMHVGQAEAVFVRPYGKRCGHWEALQRRITLHVRVGMEPFWWLSRLRERWPRSRRFECAAACIAASPSGVAPSPPPERVRNLSVGRRNRAHPSVLHARRSNRRRRAESLTLSSSGAAKRQPGDPGSGRIDSRRFSRGHLGPPVRYAAGG